MKDNPEVWKELNYLYSFSYTISFWEKIFHQLFHMVLNIIIIQDITKIGAAVNMQDIVFISKLHTIAKIWVKK